MTFVFLGMWIPDDRVPRKVCNHTVAADGTVTHNVLPCECINCPVCILCEDTCWEGP